MPPDPASKAFVQLVRSGSSMAAGSCRRGSPCACGPSRCRISAIRRERKYCVDAQEEAVAEAGGRYHSSGGGGGRGSLESN